MHVFRELGEHVATEWAAVDHAPGAFTDIAFRALRERSPLGRVTPDEIVDWALTSSLPAQHDLEASFGQPPLTLFQTDRFVVAALFWVDGTTSIHQHAFSGAFQVLAGSSLHARFDFERRTPGTDRLFFGALHARTMELLRVGDVRAIPPGREFVHSLFHLDRPSVTLLIRTRGDVGVERQYAYLPPSVAFDPFERDGELQRRQQLLGMLFTTQPARFPAAAAVVLDHADLEATFHVLRQARKIDTESTFRVLREHATARHGALIAAMIPAIDEERRRADVAELRNRVADPELRYFLALLLNAPDRDAVLALTREQVPAAPPEDTVVDWLRRLAAVRFTIQAGPATFEVSAAGFPVDEATLAALRRHLAGVPAIDDDARALETLRRAPVLAPLFRLSAFRHDAGAASPDGHERR